jgi:hypothetical protein
VSDLLPICTPREVRGRIQINGVWCIPLYCMNCGKQHGYRNEPDAASGYVGYLCDPCAERWSPLVGTMLVPDVAFAELASAEMLDTYGRILTDAEQVRVLDDPSSSLAKLARDRVSPRR